MEFKKTTIKNKQDFKAFGQKRSKAQHLVEFVLFFPFLVGIIALLSEIGYGINAGIELNSALNRAVGAASSIYRNNNNSSYKDISKEIQDNTRKILASRKVPYSNTVKVQTFEVEDFTISVATYTYTYAFTLVNTFFGAIPDEFHFKSIVISNKALFLPNSYNITDTNLANDFTDYRNTAQQNEESPQT